MTKTTPTIDEKALLPCPFCGGEVTLESRRGAIIVVLCHPDSPCRSSGLGNYINATKLDEAIAAWNRRMPLSALEAGKV